MTKLYSDRRRTNPQLLENVESFATTNKLRKSFCDVKFTKFYF